MEDCWQAKPEQRPTFKQVVDRLAAHLPVDNDPRGSAAPTVKPQVRALSLSILSAVLSTSSLGTSSSSNNSCTVHRAGRGAFVHSVRVVLHASCTYVPEQLVKHCIRLHEAQRSH
jgi:hypothetical protein